MVSEYTEHHSVLLHFTLVGIYHDPFIIRARKLYQMQIFYFFCWSRVVRFDAYVFHAILISHTVIFFVVFSGISITLEAFLPILSFGCYFRHIFISFKKLSHINENVCWFVEQFRFDNSSTESETNSDRKHLTVLLLKLLRVFRILISTRILQMRIKKMFYSLRVF